MSRRLPSSFDPLRGRRTARRRSGAAVLLLAFCFLGAGASGLRARETPRPNFLLLVSDDQRADTIHALSGAPIRTPNLDRLVHEGFGFLRAYCMGSIHGAVCQPSRAMFLSGRTLYRVPMDLKGVTTLPESLRARGWATFGTGKWHNGRASFARAFERGKAVFFGGMSNHLKVPVVDLEDGRFVGKRTGRKFSSELFADAAIEFLHSADPERPFFAYVAFTAPHDPRMPPEPYREEYYRKRPPLPPNFMPQHPFDNGWLTGRDEMLAPWPRTPEVIRDQLAEYYGMITHLDGQVGRILTALEASGRARNTIVVYFSDHGLAIGSHGLLGKQNLYEHSMRAPLLFRGPGIPAGGKSEALVYLHDVPATLWDLAGVEAPPGVEGLSLRPIWEGKAARVRDSLFTTYENLMRAVRTARWKLIRYPQIDYTQLFDLEEDPYELKNLAGDPAHASRAGELLDLLRAWQKRAGDTQPLTVPNPRPREIDLTGRPRKPDPHQPRWIVEKYFRAEPAPAGKDTGK